MASWIPGRAFARRFATSAHGHGTTDPGETGKMWRRIFFFGACPAMLLGHINCYLKTKEEEEHHVRQPFVPYDHLRIRTKRYPWGDGTRTLFHNPHVNPLPTGYEDEQ